jgi:hypothetical protein
MPDWAYRDVLYMLIDYSERAYHLLYRPLCEAEQQELFDVFRRVGEGLGIPGLPDSYFEWRSDRQLHMARDLVYSDYTSQLYDRYRVLLGAWRYRLLLAVQAWMVPEPIRRSLGLVRAPLLSELVRLYGLMGTDYLRSLTQSLLIPHCHLSEVRSMDISC